MRPTAIEKLAMIQKDICMNERTQGLSSMNTYIAGVKFLKFLNDERLKVLSSVRIMNLC